MLVHRLSGVRDHLDAQAFHQALETIWIVIRAANGYVDQQAPWKLSKEDPARAGTVLYVLAETIRRIALLMQPFVPDSASAMLDQLTIASENREFAHFGSDYALKPGITLPKPEGIFPRLAEEDAGGRRRRKRGRC